MRARRPQARRLLWGIAALLLAIGLLSGGLLGGGPGGRAGASAGSLLEGLSLPGAGSGIPARVRRFGDLETSWVVSPVSGRQLFQIASKTVFQRSGDPSPQVVPVERRAERIEARLAIAALHRDVDVASLTVAWSQLNNQVVLTVVDDRHPRPLVIATVTETDSRFHGLPAETLAEDWKELIDATIRRGRARFGGDALARRLAVAAAIALLVVLATLLLLRLRGRVMGWERRLLAERARNLDAAKASASQESTTAAGPPDPAAVPRTRSGLLRLQRSWLRAISANASLDQRLGRLRLLQWLLFWLLIALWYGAGFLILQRLPSLAGFSRDFVGAPLQILIIWFLTTLAIRISGKVIDRFWRDWQWRQGAGEPADAPAEAGRERQTLRVGTIVEAVKGLLTVTIAIVGLLTGLGYLGVPTGSILAIGGVVGLAVSFGSQNLIRDIVNGFLIIAEDQFAIGDVIELNGLFGLVENLNLRVTQLRSLSGEFITIPNGSVGTVSNLTRNWSRVHCRITVDIGCDPDEALGITRQTCHALYHDVRWSPLMLTPPEVLGIEAISDAGYTLMIWMQTAPGRHWEVAREFRLRLLRAFAAAGISVGVPRQQFIAPVPPGGGRKEMGKEA